MSDGHSSSLTYLPARGREAAAADTVGQSTVDTVRERQLVRIWRPLLLMRIPVDWQQQADVSSEGGHPDMDAADAAAQARRPKASGRRWRQPTNVAAQHTTVYTKFFVLTVLRMKRSSFKRPFLGNKDHFGKAYAFNFSISFTCVQHTHFPILRDALRD